MQYLVNCRIDGGFELVVVVQNWRCVRGLMRDHEVTKIRKSRKRFYKWLGPAMHKKLTKHLRANP